MGVCANIYWLLLLILHSPFLLDQIYSRLKWCLIRWLVTRNEIAVCLNLFRPIVHSLKCMRFCQIKYDDYCVTTFIVERKKRSKLLLSCSIPDVHSNIFSSWIDRLISMKAGAKSIRYFSLERPMYQDLNDACLSHIWIKLKVRVSPSKITLGFFFMIILSEYSKWNNPNTLELTMYATKLGFLSRHWKVFSLFVS